MLSIVQKAVVKKNEKLKEECDKPGCRTEAEAEDMLYSIAGYRKDFQPLDDLSSEEISVLNEYINNLENRIGALVKSNGIGLELIGDLKNELDELKQEVDANRKKNVRRHSTE